MKEVASVMCLLLLTTTLRAQDAAQPASDARPSSAALGWEVSSFANNYGFGARLDTPPFANGTVHVQIGASLAWVQGVPLGESDTTSKETPDIVSYIYLCLPRNSLHAKNQEDVTQDRADEGRLDNRQLTLDQSQDSDDEFDHISKGGVEQSTQCLTESKGSFFCGKSK